MSQILNLVIDARLKAVAALAMLEGMPVDDIQEIRNESQKLVSKSTELYSYVSGRAIMGPIPGQTSLDDAEGQGRR